MAFLAQSLSRLRETRLRCDVSWIDSERTPIVRNRLRETVCGQFHVAELRQSDVVVGMLGNPTAKRLILKQNGRRRTAFDALLSGLLLTRDGGAEDRASRAEADEDEVA